MANWEVELLVSSNSKVVNKISFMAPKGNINPFNSKIVIDNYYNSLTINIQAIADNEADAVDAAFYFIGQALNYISWITKSPFKLYDKLEPAQLRSRQVAKQVLDQDTWEKAFLKGREIQLYEAKLAMALGWYRKSLNSEDPIDSFLSTWLVIETICNDITLTELMSEEMNSDIVNMSSRFGKGKIFYQIKQNINTLGDSDIITDERLYNIKKRRNNIAHGSFVINDIDIIKEIIAMNNEIIDIAHRFLTQEVRTKGYV